MTSVAFEDKILVELNSDKREFEKDVKTGTAIWLFMRHKLTLGQAAGLAGLSQFEFMRNLDENGVPAIDYSVEDLNREVENIS